MRSLLRPIMLAAAVLLLLPAPAPSDSRDPAVVGHTLLLADRHEDGSLHALCSTARIAPQKFITAAHCVTDAQGEVETGLDYVIGSFPARLVWVDLTNDLAGFNVPTDPAIRGLKLARRAPKTGDAVSLAGYPMAYPHWMYFTGVVSNTAYTFPGDTRVYTIFDMSACGGNSGGPVVNARGELVSILQIGARRFEPCSSISGGATYDQLKTFLMRFLTM